MMNEHPRHTAEPIARATICHASRREARGLGHADRVRYFSNSRVCAESPRQRVRLVEQDATQSLPTLAGESAFYTVKIWNA